VFPGPEGFVERQELSFEDRLTVQVKRCPYFSGDLFNRDILAMQSRFLVPIPLHFRHLFRKETIIPGTVAQRSGLLP
jgi:hypothetical protein